MNENIPCAGGHSSAANDGLLIWLAPTNIGDAKKIQAPTYGRIEIKRVSVIMPDVVGLPEM